MDPQKNPSAPPTDWNASEKSGVPETSPPPYQDYPQFQNTGAGPAYPPPQQGYGPPPVQYGATPQGPAYPGQYYQPPPGTVVAVQPTVYVTRAPLAHPVNDYLGYSIFTMLCCCLPIGIAALINSIAVRDANLAGDLAGAEQRSRTARILNHTGLGIGIVAFIIWVAVVIVAL